MNSCSDKINADLIIKDGTVYTLDSSFHRTGSFAVIAGKIAGTGTTKEILSRYKSKNQIDASGKFIYPGFNDAHCHFYGYAAQLARYADLRNTKGPAEVLKIIQEHNNKYKLKWILGRNWDQNDWLDKSFPDKTILDKLFPDIPVFLVRVDGHACWCNSKALDIAGINSKTKVTGGTVELKKGTPSGILTDNAMELVRCHIPELTVEEIKQGLIEAQKRCMAAGLTSVTDCGLDKSEILLIREMQAAGELKIRINAMLNPNEENIQYFVLKDPFKSEKLTVNTLKIYADGALGSRGALLFSDYSDDPGNCGVQIEDQEYYDRICKIAFDNNFAVAAHAIGDKANRLMLDTFGKFLSGKNDRRWRIEHAQIIDTSDFYKFAKYSVVPSIQATHATSDMYWVKERLGSERLKGAYAYQTLLNQLGWLPNGTDFPVENIDPLFTFYASVFRTDHSGYPEGGWRTSEGLTRIQALKSITCWPAKASFEENDKGTLEPGKWADFVILNVDLMSATPREILNAEIESAWIAGEKMNLFD